MAVRESESPHWRSRVMRINHLRPARYELQTKQDNHMVRPWFKNKHQQQQQEKKTGEAAQGQVYLLLLQSIQVGIPASASHKSKLPVTPVPGNPTSSSRLLDFMSTHTYGLYTQTMNVYAKVKNKFLSSRAAWYTSPVLGQPELYSEIIYLN